LERVQKAEEGVLRFLQLSQDATCLSQKEFCQERLENAKTLLAEAEEDYKKLVTSRSGAGGSLL
jgi:hypothetical protein